MQPNHGKAMKTTLSYTDLGLECVVIQHHTCPWGENHLQNKPSIPSNKAATRRREPSCRPAWISQHDPVSIWRIIAQNKLSKPKGKIQPLTFFLFGHHSSINTEPSLLHRSMTEAFVRTIKYWDTTIKICKRNTNATVKEKQIIQNKQRSNFT